MRLTFDGLFAADLSGRARAFQSMVGGGMDVSRAAALAGLMADDGSTDGYLGVVELVVVDAHGRSTARGGRRPAAET